MIKRNSQFIIVGLALLLILTLTACVESNNKTGTPQANSTISTEITTPTPISTRISTRPEPSSTLLPSQADHYSVIQLSDDIADIVEKVKPAVVFISVETQGRDLFGRPVTQAASGSGAIISPDGYILTNNHVVENSSNVEVSLPGRSETFEAKVIGTDPLTDLAVIKIEGQGFPTAPFGDASKLRPGNLVITIGNPLGLAGGPTTTLGVVSNTERSFSFGESTYYDSIQTDAAINPGNSGGPLINLNGEIVGINAVLESGAQNIGFAISASTAKPVYEALTAAPHRVIRPWLGLGLQTVTPDMAAKDGLSRQSGVVISSVEGGSPGDKTGLKVSDIITRFDGKEAIEATQLIKDLWHHKVGDKISLTYWRDEQETEVIIELSVERPRPR